MSARIYWLNQLIDLITMITQCTEKQSILLQELNGSRGMEVKHTNNFFSAQEKSCENSFGFFPRSLGNLLEKYVTTFAVSRESIA